MSKDILSESGKGGLRVPLAPGSREPSPDGLGRSGFDPSREEIEAAIKQTEYKYFGDYEMSDGQIEAVDTLVDCAQALIRVRAALSRRSVPVMDPVWSAAFNAALDMIAAAIRDSDEHRNGEDGNRLSGEAMPARASQEASPSPEIPNPGAPK